MNLIKALIVTVTLLFSASVVTEQAFARKTLPSEVEGFQTDAEATGILILQIVLALAFLLVPRHIDVKAYYT